MSQRQLIDEIRVLLDGTCETCTHVRCAANIVTLRTLVADNPTSTFSTKVMYNIGIRRYARLTSALGAAQDQRARAGADAISVRGSRSSSLRDVDNTVMGLSLKSSVADLRAAGHLRTESDS